MPTERFFRLPNEKKVAIREAAVREFCRVPLENVSINKIIQDAEISRGSFYTYFEDKRDIIRYILEDFSEELVEFSRKRFAENHGDVFYMAEEILKKGIEKSQKVDSRQFFENVIASTCDLELVNEKKRREVEQYKSHNEMRKNTHHMDVQASHNAEEKMIESTEAKTVESKAIESKAIKTAGQEAVCLHTELDSVRCNAENKVEWLYEWLQSEEEYVKERRAALHMLEGFIVQGLGTYIMGIYSQEEVIENFRVKVNILRKGMDCIYQEKSRKRRGDSDEI